MMTIEEQERHAYQAGDTTLAGALARIVDLQAALVAARSLLTDPDAEAADADGVLETIEAALAIED